MWTDAGLLWSGLRDAAREPMQIATRAADVPHAWLFYALCGTAVLAQVIALALSLVDLGRWRRLRAAVSRGDWSGIGRWSPPGPVLPSLLASAWLLIPLSAAVSVGPVREAYRRATAAHALSHSVGGPFLNGADALAFAAAAGVIAALVGALGWLLAAAARQQARRLLGGEAAASVPGISPGLVAVAGVWIAFALLPVLVGTMAYARLVEAIWWATDPFERENLRFLTEPRRALELASRIQLAGSLLAGAATLAILSRGRRAPRPLSWRRTVLVSGLLLAAAGACFAAAAPFRAENATVWPPGVRLWTSLCCDVERSRLPGRGPDELRPAPVLDVGRDWVRVDGLEEPDADELESRLVSLRNNFRLLHPGEEDAGELIIVCAPDLPAGRVGEALGIAGRSGFRSATFGFTSIETAHRPWLGDKSREHLSGARASFSGAMEPRRGGMVVRLAAYATCAQVADRVRSLRQRHHEVELVVE